VKLLAAILAAPLAAYAYLGLFSRYAADDYCTAGQVATRGLLGLEAQLYEAWSGRFAFTFIVGAVELIGAGVARVLPTLAIMAWVAALTWAVSRLGSLLGWRKVWLQAFVLAESIVLVTLASTADVGQSLYWQTGMLTYLAPLVLLACLTGVVTERVRLGCAGPGARLAIGGLAFVAAGTSETYAAAQVAGLGLAGSLGWLGLRGRRRRVFLALVAAGLVGSLLAFSIVALAPGNTVRGGGPRPGWGYVAGAALDDARQFVHDFYRFSTLQAVLALCVPLGVAFFAGPPLSLSSQGLRKALAWGVLIGLGGLIEIVACLMPSFYALSAPEPGRARIIPQLVLVCLTLMAGYLAGLALSVCWPRYTQLRPVVAALVVLTLASPVLVTRGVLADVNEARAYAERWDGVDAQVRADRAAGVQDVVIAPLAPTGTVRGMDFVGPNPADWLNECVARYYGIRSIAAREPR
jgi:hypothetical protein